MLSDFKPVRPLKKHVKSNAVPNTFLVKLSPEEAQKFKEYCDQHEVSGCVVLTQAAIHLGENQNARS